MQNKKLREIVTDQLLRRRMLIRLGKKGRVLLIGRMNIHDFSRGD
jgi:hypothetical protein